MGRAISNRKWLMENTVMHRQPAQLSESRGECDHDILYSTQSLFSLKGVGGK